ncbi:hypothetical protein GSI_04441 [Ganoderma sinense ZZ0214-1]|uniref:Uncharacterized protein n=1 Tax=Ganoderma sinense ZZ0214-1 TaxID=1077348 RepID=A0A2G8SJ67_9APHY|nr:hypothetical protein GSI_04441 [Ganoderma sinense ZZ0214-1]
MPYLEPLLAFPNIKTFNLWSSSVIPSIHDDDLAQFGAAWPRLTSFHVSHLVSRQDIVSSGAVPPTLSGLVDFARRCPHLESFRTPALDAKVFPDKTATLPLGHRLQSISITDSVTLPSPTSRAFSEVARILDCVFPSVVLEDARAKAIKNMKGWDKLTELVKTMRLHREARALGVRIREID